MKFAIFEAACFDGFKRVFGCVESKVRFLIVGVWPVTVKTFVRKNRPHVAIERDLLPCGQLNRDEHCDE